MSLNNRISDEEGVSEVLGYILIFGIVVAAIGIIVAFGYPTINSAKDSANFQKNQNSMQLLVTDLSEIAKGPIRGAGPSMTKSFDIQTGSLKINTTSTPIEVFKNGDLIYSGRVGEIKYRFNQKILSIENNGFFAKSRGSNSSSCLIRPPIQFDSLNSSKAYINFHIINLTGESGEFSGIKEIKFSNSDFNIIHETGINSTTSNFTISLKTNYVGGWERVFEDKLQDQGIDYKIIKGSDYIILIVSNTESSDDIFLNVFETKMNVDIK